MQNHLDEILYNTGEEIFENLAFILTMPEGEGIDDFDMSDFEPASFGDEDSPEAVLDETGGFEATGDDEDDFKGLDFDFGDHDSTGTASDETLVASIHFCGDSQGHLFLEASARLLPVIGMNMLGLDDPDALTHEEQKDAFCELMNVICGNLLPAIAGEKAVFSLESAEIQTDSTTIPETFEGKTPLASAHFGLEIGHAKLAIFADEKLEVEYTKNIKNTCVEAAMTHG